jgi:hypothetical protein
MTQTSGSNDAPHRMNLGRSPQSPLPAKALEVQRRIAACRRPLLVAHVRLDGDALGSELGLAHILRARGQDPHVVNDSTVPEIYQFLPGADEAGTSAADLRGDYDLVIALDLPSWSRAKAIRERLPPTLQVAGIDHHPPIESLGDSDWVDPSFSSVGEMVYLLASSARWKIPPDAATCLYAAILTDTGRFAFSNTTASSLRAAADLVYKDELEHWGSRSDVRLVTTVDPGGETPEWKGKVGFVPNVLKAIAPSSANAGARSPGPSPAESNRCSPSTADS